jgi:hypothetical protein
VIVGISLATYTIVGSWKALCVHDHFSAAIGKAKMAEAAERDLLETKRARELNMHSRPVVRVSSMAEGGTMIGS